MKTENGEKLWFDIFLLGFAGLGINVQSMVVYCFERIHTNTHMVMVNGYCLLFMGWISAMDRASF